MRTFQLIYTSKAQNEFTADSLSLLGAAASNNNRQAGITGILLYSKGYFMQALEGDKHFVSHLFEIFANDSRHNEVTILSSGNSSRRLFEKWSMGIISLDHPGNHNFISDARVLSLFLEFSQQRCHSKYTIAALRYFRERLQHTQHHCKNKEAA